MALAGELSLANAELTRLNREQAEAARVALVLERTRRQVRVLEETDRARKELLANVSHELRTPLRSILTGTTVLLRRDDLAGARDELGSIAAEARRLGRLVGDMLEMARIEGGALDLRCEPVDVAEAVEAAVDRLHRHSPERPVRWDAGAAAGVRVLADWDRLAQILDNLVGNADRLAPPRTPLRIDVAAAGGAVEIGVTDSRSGDRPRSCGSGSSTASSAAATAPPGPGSAWRSSAPSSRRRGDGCGSRTRPAAAPASPSASRRRRSPRRWRRPAEAVALALDGDDQPRVGGVGLELQPQPLDEGAQVVALARVLRTPDAAEQDAVVDDPAGVAGELDEERALGRGEVDLDAGAEDAAGAEVDADIGGGRRPATARPGDGRGGAPRGAGRGARRSRTASPGSRLRPCRGRAPCRAPRRGR